MRVFHHSFYFVSRSFCCFVFYDFCFPRVWRSVYLRFLLFSRFWSPAGWVFRSSAEGACGPSRQDAQSSAETSLLDSSPLSRASSSSAETSRSIPIPRAELAQLCRTQSSPLLSLEPSSLELCRDSSQGPLPWGSPKSILTTFFPKSKSEKKW